jgi:peptidoglycan/LPS O-acetylase OafA/YrhL
MAIMHHTFTSLITGWLNSHGFPWLGNFFAYLTISGVDLFFVLSGIVLLRPFLRRQKKIKIGEYFKRRFKRIYPPYFASLVFSAAVVWFNNTFPTWYNERGLRMQFSWLETLKELPIINFDGTFYNLSWWSLQIELVFYMVAPLVILVFPAQEKLRDRKVYTILFFTLVCTLLVQVLFTNYLPYIYSTSHYKLSAGKSIEYTVCFATGLLLATKDFNIKHAYIFMISGVILVIGGFALVSQSLIFFSIMHSGYGLLYGGVVILAFHREWLNNLLSSPFMIWLGERSYSLFLIFLPVFYLTDNLVSHFLAERNTLYGVLTRGLGIPLALLAAILLFHFVERKQARGLTTGHIFWPWQLYKLKEQEEAPVLIK